VETNMKNICVFCGSHKGNNSVYEEAAQKLGAIIARHNVGLVYGGGGIGLMGTIADTVLKNSGKVIGVIPKSLVDQELAHSSLSELHVVKTMHERKALMSELSDAFIAMPGGMGTLEEFAEIVTWAQLGFHMKPFGLLNIAHYYDGLIEFFRHGVKEGFIHQRHIDMIIIDEDPDRLFTRISQSCIRPFTSENLQERI
jgi:uncharacterized protein (TIGR00730 family)